MPPSPCPATGCCWYPAITTWTATGSAPVSASIQDGLLADAIPGAPSPSCCRTTASATSSSSATPPIWTSTATGSASRNPCPGGNARIDDPRPAPAHRRARLRLDGLRRPRTAVACCSGATRSTRPSLHPDGEGADWRLALLHHPWDYLAEFDTHEARQTIHLHRDLVLRGHLHEGEAFRVVPAGPGPRLPGTGRRLCLRRQPSPQRLPVDRAVADPERVRVLFRAWVKGAWQVDRNQPGCPDGEAELRPRPPDRRRQGATGPTARRRPPQIPGRPLGRHRLHRDPRPGHRPAPRPTASPSPTSTSNSRRPVPRRRTRIDDAGPDRHGRAPGRPRATSPCAPPWSTRASSSSATPAAARPPSCAGSPTAWPPTGSAATPAPPPATWAWHRVRPGPAPAAGPHRRLARLHGARPGPAPGPALAHRRRVAPRLSGRPRPATPTRAWTRTPSAACSPPATP